PALGDAVGVGEGEEDAGVVEGGRRRFLLAPFHPSPLPQARAPVPRLLPDAGQRTAVYVVAGGAAAAEGFEAEAEIDVGGARPLAVERVAFAEEGGDLGGEAGQPEVPRSQQHVGEAGVEGEVGHLPPVFGEGTRTVEGAEREEEAAGLREGAGRGRVEPGEVAGCGAPGGEVEG